jgi:hypothetical protein
MLKKSFGPNLGNVREFIQWIGEQQPGVCLTLQPDHRVH